MSGVDHILENHTGDSRARLRRAAAAILLVGAAPIVLAAPRGDAETRTGIAPPTSFVRNDRPIGYNHAVPQDLHTDAARARSSFPGAHLSRFTPPHIVRITPPSGQRGTAPGDIHTDASRNRTSFSGMHFMSFTLPHGVRIDPANGFSTTAPGSVRTDAVLAGSVRPEISFGIGRDSAGGVRADIGLRFRLP